MTLRSLRQDARSATLAASTAVAGVVAMVSASQAQLTMSVWKAESGQVYQVLQHRAGDDLGVGVDEVRVTSVSANSFVSEVCTSPAASSAGRPILEAIAAGPIGGGRPIDLAFKSGLIADASPPCFAGGAEDGLGRICVGPDCGATCECESGAACSTFTMTDGVALDTATPETPAGSVVAPLMLNQPHCRANNDLTYGFGATGTVTTQSEVCAVAPADGIRLVSSPSAYEGGRDGTTIVIAFAAMPEENLAVSAAGFGIDNDGRNAFDCDAPGRVVAAVQASEDEAPSQAPPLPPVDLDGAERRCQQAIGRAGRRFSSRVLRALQVCRDKILAGTLRIRAEQCDSDPAVRKTLASSARIARAAIAGRCDDVDLTELLTCGDRVDDLIRPDHAGGCLYDTHRSFAEQMVVLEYGF